MCSKQEEGKNEGQSRSVKTHATRGLLQLQSKALESSRALAVETRCRTLFEVVEEAGKDLYPCMSHSRSATAQSREKSR